MIPTISVTGGLPAMWLPLSQVMIVVGILEGYTDWKRHCSDKSENTQAVKKFSREALCETPRSRDIITPPSVPYITTTTWESVRVGDIILCSNRESIPADMLLLASSRPDGRAMFETASLDGETNLKFRFVPTELFDHGFATYENSQLLSGVITYDPPSPQLDSFHGVCAIQLSCPGTNAAGEAGLQKTFDFPINLENVALRGCKLRNTEWVIGLVLYAGHDTKIYQNTSSQPRKLSSIELKTNNLLLISFCFLLGVCLSYSVGSVIMDVTGYTEGKPFFLPTNPIKRAFTRFASWNLLIVNLIPISLFFFLNITRALQARTMQSDTSMEHPETRTRLAVRNDKLNSDLGQVQYIFTDKTGTLTRNYMELKYLCISGVSYGSLADEFVDTPHVALEDPALRRCVDEQNPDVWDFFLHLAVNNVVFLETPGDDNINRAVSSKRLLYSASSADEGVLVYSALHFGFPLVGQVGNMLEVERPDGSLLKTEILARFNFTSVRKRSSVLARWDDPKSSTGERIVLFTKGADNVIRDLLVQNSLRTKPVEQTFRHVVTYAKQGLRVLCIAQREISRELLDAWKPKYDQALISMEDSAEVDRLAAQMETELSLLGCVGVEDKLADDVAVTVERLKAAHVQVVMLTGDKLETAINIGLQTRIFPDNANITRLDVPETIVKQIDEFLHAPHGVEAFLRYSSAPLDPDAIQQAFPKNGSCFVIDSAALSAVLQYEPSLLATLISVAAGVIICRASPQQKADVVMAVRTYFKNKVVTLAVGDGGNDCSMIQCANIGVGIRGSEGLQAFNVSDYGVSRFRDLAPLLLVHGRWNNRRIGKLIIYTLSKMVVINIPQIAAGLFTLFTPQRIFAESINQFVNPVFSSLAPILFAVLDCDIPGETAMEYPISYAIGRNREHFGVKAFVLAALNAVSHGLIAFSVPFALMGMGYVDKYGRTLDLWTVGTTAFFCSLFLMTQKLNLECVSSLPLVLVVNLASVGVFFPAMFGLRPLRETAHNLVGTPIFFVTWALVFFLGIFRDFFWKMYRRHRRPSPTHRLQRHVEDKRWEHIQPTIPTRKTLDEYCFFDQPDPSVVGAFQKCLQRRSE